MAGMVILIAMLVSCHKDKAGSGSKTSAYNDQSSHNVGTLCLGCHGTGGSNTYWWTVAGTVYNVDTTLLGVNTTIYLFTGVNGTGAAILVLPADGKGNFYTSGSVNFGSGVYPEVKSPSGDIRSMQSSTTNGNCNSCHTSGNRIVVN